MKKKSIKTKIKNLLIGTFTFSSLFGGNPAQAQSTNAQEEFRKEQQANRAEFKAYQQQQEAEWKTHKEQPKNKLKTSRTSQNNEVMPEAPLDFPIKNKPEKAPVYSEDTPSFSPASSSDSPITNLEQYEKMLGLLPQMLYFMDVVDNKNQNIKAESNKRMYYEDKALNYAKKFGTLNNEEAKTFFAKEFNGAQIIETDGMRFVSYKGKGYEIKPNGHAKWDMDCRQVGPNSDIKTRISKATMLKKNLYKQQQNKLRR